MVDLQIIAQRMLELDGQEVCQSEAFNRATREESERIGADFGELRMKMLAWIKDHAIFTADGGWSLRPALEKLRKEA